MVTNERAHAILCEMIQVERDQDRADALRIAARLLLGEVKAARPLRVQGARQVEIEAELKPVAVDYDGIVKPIEDLSGDRPAD